MSEAIKVAVRVRPFNARERERGARCIVRMSGATTTILHPDSEESRAFTFDHSYWSHDGFEADEAGYLRPAGDSSSYASQEHVFADLGTGLIDNAWAGYNVCLFAYGQTGSGKSYSVVGYGENRGIVPLACEEIFRRKAAQESDALQVHVTVSMLEIYNERIRDLLGDGKKQKEMNFSVQKDEVIGMMCPGLTSTGITDKEGAATAIALGNTNRSVGATNLNEQSSRSHMIVTLTVFSTSKVNGAQVTRRHRHRHLRHPRHHYLRRHHHLTPSSTPSRSTWASCRSSTSRAPSASRRRAPATTPSE